MELKIWAYMFASVGFLIGIWCLKNKKWSWGGWIVCLSLGIFVGGNLNINEISPSITNSFNRINEKVENTKRQLEDLSFKVTQVMSLKQEVTQTVNVVTEVKKEIANIREAIHQQYAAFEKEVFLKNDLGKRVATYYDSANPNRALLFFELQKIPEINSIQITDNKGQVAPPSTYEVKSNIIVIHIASDRANLLFKNDIDYYEIKYIPDTILKEDLLTIKNLEIKKINNIDFNIKYNLKNENKE